MAFRAGGFSMPTSSGFFSVSGLGFRPQALIFFGGNQPDEDTFTQPEHPGVFCGFVWLDATTGELDSQAHSQIWQGGSFKPLAIHMSADTGASTDYQAAIYSFDEDGFTLNVTVPASGNRPIHWLAYGDFEGVHGSTMFSNDHGLYNFPLEYQPSTVIKMHHWVNGNLRDMDHEPGVYFSMGVNNRSALNPGHTSNAGAQMMRTFSQWGAIGLTLQFANFYSTTTLAETVRPWIIGQVLDARDHASPFAEPGMGMTISLNGYPTRDSAIWAPCESWSDYVIISPDVGVSQDRTSTSFGMDAVEAALFFGTTGYSTFQQIGPNCAYMFGVLTPEYQGCVGMDFGTGPGASGEKGFFQSREMCYVTHIQPPGVRAASGELVGKAVRLTGTIADNPSGGSNLVQMFGQSYVTQGSQFFMML